MSGSFCLLERNWVGMFSLVLREMDSSPFPSSSSRVFRGHILVELCYLRTDTIRRQPESSLWGQVSASPFPLEFVDSVF